MARIGSYEFFLAAAKDSIGLPKIGAAVIALNREDFKPSRLNRVELGHLIGEGKSQLQRQFDGEKL